MNLVASLPINLESFSRDIQGVGVSWRVSSEELGATWGGREASRWDPPGTPSSPDKNSY